MTWAVDAAYPGRLRGIDVAAVLGGVARSVAAGERAMGVFCAAHHHDSLVPIEVHHVWPLGHGGPNVADNRVPLCANAHGSVHYLLDLMLKAEDGVVPWETRRRYGPGVRFVAEAGHRQITAHRSA